MNLKNMRRLRARLRSRKNPVGFGMANWFLHGSRSLVTPAAICRAVETHPCGTVACLASHAAIIAWQSGDVPRKRNVSIRDLAAEWLGLSNRDAIDLFVGKWEDRPDDAGIEDLTKAQAITELTRLIDAEASGPMRK